MRIALLLAVAGALVPAATASASTIAFSGSTVTYTAGAGEANRVLVSLGQYSTTCGGLAVPCLQVWDSGAHITSAAGGCEVASADPIVGDTARCPLPASVSADLGDRDDAYWDWDGPSVIDAGAGNDNPIFGAGGDDVIRGGVGSDLLLGQDGDDALDGGPGDDYLEGVPCGCLEEELTHGRDRYAGGGGNDSVSYEGRSENLSLSVDGVANDGAPGEGDDIGADIGTVVGGHGSDILTGNAGRNVFGGGEGDDALIGLGGDDQLAGGVGNDRLDGGPGTDVLGGDDGDDMLAGGEGVDRMYGDDVTACLAYSCPSGQDRIEARDGAREQVDCGPGTDTVIADAADVMYDSVQLSNQCESVDRGAAAGTAKPFAIASARVSGHRLVVRVSVPGPGVVRARVRGARASRKVARAGSVKLALRAPRRVRKVTVTFTPRGGAAVTRTATVRHR